MASWFHSIDHFRQLARICNYSSTQIADASGITRRHLQRYLHTGKSSERKIAYWLTALRLSDGKRLLGNDKQVKDVAFLLGYKRANHFTRQFKEEFGITPAQLPRSETTRIESECFEVQLLRLRKEGSIYKAGLHKSLSRKESKCKISFRY